MVSRFLTLLLGGRADVLSKKGWHFVPSSLFVFLIASVCKALCSLLKSGTWWMIFGWKLGLLSKNPNFFSLVRSAVRSFGLLVCGGFSSPSVAAGRWDTVISLCRAHQRATHLQLGAQFYIHLKALKSKHNINLRNKIVIKKIVLSLLKGDPITQNPLSVKKDMYENFYFQGWRQ